MTVKRNTKAKIQTAATSAQPVPAVSPRQIMAYGRTLPLEMGQKFMASCERGNRTYNRTRASVIEDKMQARRTARRTRVY